MAPASRQSAATKSNKSSSGWAAPASNTNTQPQHIPFQESHRVECNKPDCDELFATEKEMKNHKKYSPTHFYCKRCDVDCKDWEDLTKHKVDMMAPFIEGKIQASEDNMPKHIVCEFCGEDFKSFGGRKIHRRTVHPADQDVKCPGCETQFIRAANMISHIENNGCSEIRPSDLYRAICQKFVVKQVLKAPDRFLRALGTATDPSETQDEEDGGVTLLDHEDEAQMAGYTPLQAANYRSPKLSRGSPGTWPDLPSQGSLEDSMSSMSLNSSRPSTAATAPHRSTAITRPSVWNTSSKASEALFPYAKRTPPEPGDWNAVLAQREQEFEAQKGTNVMTARWWDPSTSEYKPHIFWDEGMGAYTCKFPDCLDDGTAFHALVDLQDHIKMFHLPDQYHCPVCFKRFNKPSSLVAHAESTFKCNVRASGRFKSMIDEISGGLLDAKAVNVPKIYRPDTAVVRYDGKQPGYGIMDTKFTGKMPNA